MVEVDFASEHRIVPATAHDRTPCPSPIDRTIFGAVVDRVRHVRGPVAARTAYARGDRPVAARH